MNIVSILIGLVCLISAAIITFPRLALFLFGWYQLNSVKRIMRSQRVTYIFFLSAHPRLGRDQTSIAPNIGGNHHESPKQVRSDRERT